MTNQAKQVLQREHEIQREISAHASDVMEVNASLRAEIERLKQVQLEWQHAEEAQRFLANAVSVLSASLDYGTTLESLTRLAIPRLADWCAVYVVEHEHQIRRVASVRNGDDSCEAIKAISTMVPLDCHAGIGPARVMRTGEHELQAPISDAVFRGLALTPGQLVRASDKKPAARYLCVPLPARGRSIGALAFVSCNAEQPYGEADLSLARDLGRAAGLAIDNTRLYREAQEANRLKDEFVAMVSHELRTPLTPILGCVHLLRTAKLTPSNFNRALEMIERNARAQVQIVEDLLDVSRIVAGKLHLSLGAVEIASVIEAALDSVRPMAESKSVQIFKEIDCQGIVDGDKDRLQQILWNLLSNAVKFTPAGGRVVTSVNTTSEQVCIAVSDTGVGITADFLPYVFDRFRQGDTPDSKRVGLGLGLAIVRHLVELHNGFIEAASPGPGHGTTFTVRLPLRAPRAVHAG